MELLDQATARTWLATAVEEARAGLAEGGIPIGAALYGPDGDAARARAQPARPGRRPVHARRDGRLPGGGTAAVVPRHDHGHDALALLVLLRAGPAVRHLPGGGRRGRHLPRRARLAGRARRARSCSSTIPSASAMMRDFIKNNPALWNEDIGE